MSRNDTHTGVRLTARRNRTSMALGRTATVSGQVTPAHRGQHIRLQHKKGQNRRTVQAKLLLATGRYHSGPHNIAVTRYRY